MSAFKLPIPGGYDAMQTLNLWAAELRAALVPRFNKEKAKPVKRDMMVFDGTFWRSGKFSEVISIAGFHATDLTITAGGTYTVAHDLGVIPSAVILTKMEGTSSIYEGQARDTSNVYITNQSSSVSATVSVLVLP